ncbi:unnamed protein product [Thelazia callipaeda]|uniref:Nuclear receptor domain-containing protein n=1 Tax=Thelazia callipaeda TaxID=103827 RepID=A0A0N5CQR2_THECL|nr:unnamed protein product [Thelazia callipaeda]
MKISKTTESCAVCGDLATGFHYDVASCNGKTFFRRTLVSNRIYKCYKNGNCTFDKDMRCACRACRFNKCVACNRTGRMTSPQEVSISTTSSNCSLDSVDISQNCETTSSISTEKELYCLLSKPTDSDRKRSRSSLDQSNSTASKRAYTISALLGFSKPTSISNSNENLSLKCMKPDTKSSSTSDLTFDFYNAVRKQCIMSEKHEKLILQLTRVQDGIDEFMITDKSNTSISILDLLTRPSVIDTSYNINNSDDENEQQKLCSSSAGASLNWKLEVTVEYAKTFDVFQWMPLRDKIILLRDVIFVLILLDTAYKKSISKSISVLNHRNEKEKQLNGESTGMSLLIESMNRIKLDRKEFSLLKAIAFVHPECFGLSLSSFRKLSCKRQLILDALFNYMIVRYDKRGPVRFGHTLSILWSVYRAINSYLEDLIDLDLELLTTELLANKLPEHSSVEQCHMYILMLISIYPNK